MRASTIVIVRRDYAVGPFSSGEKALAYACALGHSNWELMEMKPGAVDSQPLKVVVKRAPDGVLRVQGRAHLKREDTPR